MTCDQMEAALAAVGFVASFGIGWIIADMVRMWRDQ